MANHRRYKTLFFKFSKISILIKEEIGRICTGAYYKGRLLGPKLASSFATLLRVGEEDKEKKIY